MNDKFKMVRYDINGEVKNGHPSIWERIKYVFIAALLLYPVIAETLFRRE